MKNYFTEDELSCPCCGENKFNPETLVKFNMLREACGFALPMTSGYRCPAYNEAKGYTQTHSTGQAGDLQVHRTQAYLVLLEAFKLGFTGIGIAQKGDSSTRFIHLDDLSPEEHPRPTIWSY